MPILELKDVYKLLGNKEILKSIDFSVESGEIYGFLGPNGAGKTTTMKSILGLITPDSGSIKIFGEEGLSYERRKKIGFMPENTYLYKHLTGREFLRFNARFFGISGKNGEEKIQTLLTKVGLLESADQYLKHYSKGMLQRVGLAQAIINDPEILFLDEPMSGLDPLGRKMVKDLLLTLNASGTTIFFNTHILADVESICERISIIHKGNIIVKGKKISDITGSLENYFISQIGAYSDGERD